MGKTKILKIYHLPPKTTSMCFLLIPLEIKSNSILLFFFLSLEEILRESLWNLFVDFKKSCRLLKVKIDGEHDSRYALLTFRKSEDVDKALIFATNKSINGVRFRAEPFDRITNGKNFDIEFLFSKKQIYTFRK